MKKYTIRESIHGNFFYHLALDGKPICGTEKMTMETMLELRTWGLKTHLKEKYCKECNALKWEREK